MMRRIRQAFLLLFLVPLATHAVWWQLQDHPRSWSEANWSSSGVLPPPARSKEAVVHVLAGRTGRWKGIFAHHSWIVIKAKGASRYTRYEVVGWGRPVRIDAYAADGARILATGPDGAPVQVAQTIYSLDPGPDGAFAIVETSAGPGAGGGRAPGD